MEQSCFVSMLTRMGRNDKLLHHIVSLNRLPSWKPVAIGNLLIGVASEEAVTAEGFVFGGHVGKDDGDAGVEISSLIVLGVNGQDEIPI